MMNTPEEVASEISQRIAQLNELSDADLKNEMQSLKAAILENPAATSLLMDEDVGKMVAALRRITGFAISQASKPKTRTATAKPKAKQLSAEELASALDDDDF